MPCIFPPLLRIFLHILQHFIIYREWFVWFIFTSSFFFVNPSFIKSLDISKWKCQKISDWNVGKEERKGRKKIHTSVPSIINNPSEITALNSFLLPATWIIRFSRKKSESHMVTFSEGKANIELLSSSSSSSSLPSFPYIQRNIKKKKKGRTRDGAVYPRECVLLARS